MLRLSQGAEICKFMLVTRIVILHRRRKVTRSLSKVLRSSQWGRDSDPRGKHANDESEHVNVAESENTPKCWGQPLGPDVDSKRGEC